MLPLQVVLGRHKQTHKHHALKVVYLNKPGLKEKHVAVLQREGTYLRKLQHKNIVRCLKVYQSPQQWVFVLEYLKGGMLLNDLAKVCAQTLTDSCGCLVCTTSCKCVSLTSPGTHAAQAVLREDRSSSLSASSVRRSLPPRQ